MKKYLVILLVATFSVCSVLAHAAGKSWFVIKDKNGVCKVIQAKDKTPKTIGGPFTSKDAADKFKTSKCPAAKKSKAKKSSTSTSKSKKAKPDNSKSKKKTTKKSDTKSKKTKSTETKKNSK
jgi:hypothetical protein